MMNRRFFIRAGLTLAAAPMIVRADSIMKINPYAIRPHDQFSYMMSLIDSYYDRLVKEGLIHQAYIELQVNRDTAAALGPPDEVILNWKPRGSGNIPTEIKVYDLDKLLDLK